MDTKVGSQDHRQNEFYSFRYSSRFEKGDIVEIRLGADLESARYQARKSFPDVLNEYWWLKPSDVPALKEIPLKVSDVFYYHGGIPVLVLLTANGSLTRKAQIFIRKREETKSNLDANISLQIDSLEEEELNELLLDQSLLIKRKAATVLNEKFPKSTPYDPEAQVAYQILLGNFESLHKFGEEAVDQLIERFFVTSNAKETEKILEALISFGDLALAKLEDISEYISPLASPYYSKRINWTIGQISKLQSKKKKSFFRK